MTYTQSQVFKTAFPYVNWSTGLGDGLPNGINQVCICCKAGSMIDGKVIGHVYRVIDSVDLRPWAEFYKTKDYAAYRCGVCGYQWSWYR